MIYFKFYKKNFFQLLTKYSLNVPGETLLSPICMCGPVGLKFNRPVELRLPHRANVDPEQWSFNLKSSDTTNDGKFIFSCFI